MEKILMVCFAGAALGACTPVRHSGAVAEPTGVAGVVAAEARRQNVPVRLALAVAKTESNFNPRARSSAGAVGVMQILPSTWRTIGCSGSMTNAADNARCGVRYLAQGLREGGERWAVARYHGGPNARAHGRSTHSYASKVLGRARLASRD